MTEVEYERIHLLFLKLIVGKLKMAILWMAVCKPLSPAENGICLELLNVKVASRYVLVYFGFIRIALHFSVYN